MINDTIISMEQVSACYDDKYVFNNVSFRVGQHDFIGVVGPNGGGKTTLIRLVLGLMRQESGTVTYYHNGRVVPNISMGYLQQYNNVDRSFPISVIDVVLSGLNNCKSLFWKYSDKHREQAVQMLHRFGLEHVMYSHIGSLSGGQLQRVLLARAIVSHPDVVVLDEPNTYVDRKFQKQMYEMLHEINGESAIVLVSHDLGAVVRNARRVAFVNHSVKTVGVTDMTWKDVEDCFGCSSEIFENKTLFDLLSK